MSFSYRGLSRIKKAEKRFQLIGWLLFLSGCVFFILQSLTNDNFFGLTGSVLFLTGCVVFLIPLVGRWNDKG